MLSKRKYFKGFIACLKLWRVYLKKYPVIKQVYLGILKTIEESWMEVLT